MLHGQPRRWNDVDLALAQLAGIELWLSAAHAGALDPAGLDRQRRALAARTSEQLALAGSPLQPRLPRRLVLGHRNDWFAKKLERALCGTGLLLVSRVRDADEAVGCVVAEQPDLLLVEDRLPGLATVALVQDVLRYSRHCAVGVQVQDGDRAGRLLDAGVAYVWHRQVSPAEVAQQLVGSLTPDLARRSRMRRTPAVGAPAPVNWPTDLLREVTSCAPPVRSPEGLRHDANGARR